MIFFGRKKRASPEVDLSWLVADLHSHLVPGIDDGSPDVTTSVSLIKGMVDLGYKKIITTPHILWEVYPNTPDMIINGFEEVKEAVRREKIDVELHAAAEYFMDDHFDEHLQSKQPLLKLSGNMVLVEFSMLTAPMDLQQVIFELQMQNYQPVLAHPERYVYLSRHKSTFDDLKAAGCYFQANLLAFTGHYGNAVLELAEYLLKHDMYDFAGTDLHGRRHLDGLRKLSPAHLQKLQDSGKIRNHLL
jgi:tyrosine-protein phosphatase YwqE